MGRSIASFLVLAFVVTGTPLVALTAVGPIGFDEAEFPPDQGLFTLTVTSLDGQPIPPLRIEALAGFSLPSVFLSGFEDLAVSPMTDPVLYVNATQQAQLDFGGDVSGVTFDGQVFAFSSSQNIGQFLTGTVRFRALGASGSQVAQGSAVLPFDVTADPIVIGRPVSFSSPVPFRRLEITVEVTGPTAFSFLLIDNLAYSVNAAQEPTELFDEVPFSSTGTSPTVATAPDGRRIVAWVEPMQGTIFAQFLGPRDEAVTAPLIVNSRNGAVGRPAVAFDASGNATFAWQSGGAPGAGDGRLPSAGTSSSIVARSFSPQGQSLSGEQTVSQSADATTPSVDTTSAGDAVVTWQTGGKIKGRRVDRTLGARGPSFDISAGAGQSDARVATAASGDFAVSWTESVGGTPAVLARFFRADGTPKGDALRVSANGAGAATRPAIASDASGNVVVVWQQADGGGFDVLQKRFDATGSSRGTAQRVHSVQAGDQTMPSVAANSTGDFVVAWESSVGLGLGFDPERPAASTSGGASIVARGFSPAGASGAEVEVAGVEAGATPTAPQVSIGDDDQITVAFQRKGGNGKGVFSRRLETPVPTVACSPGPQQLCLADGRFTVRVTWRDFSGNTGSGNATPLTTDTGAFWFFDQANVEIVLKVLDARGVNGKFWVFYGALSNVEYTITVEDTVTGKSRSYFNPLRSFGSVGDTSALPGSSTLDPEALRLRGLQGGRPLAVDTQPLRSGSAACAGTEAKLCLQQSRFEVSVTWKDFTGKTGTGTAIPLTADTGYFWFFDDANVELVVKVLDARGVNGKFWVFYGALSNVEYTITVRDTVTGNTKTYTNPLRTFGSVGDTSALPGN